MDFIKHEENAEKIGRLLKYGNKFASDVDCMWFVTYSEEGEYPKILPSTASFNKKGVEIQKQKIKKKTEFEKFMIDIMKVYFFVQDTDFEGINYNKIDSNLVKLVKTSSRHDNYVKDFLSTRSFCMIDTETTGMKKDDEVIDICAIKVKNGKIIDEFQKFILPSVSIAKEALKIHGITKDFLKEKGEEAFNVFHEFSDFVSGYKLAGHNVMFDIRMIKQHCFSIGIDIELKEAFDTLKLSRKMLKLESHKLENIIKQFELDKDLVSHGSRDDAIGTLRYSKILRKILD